jgi:hypothetical protein
MEDQIVGTCSTHGEDEKCIHKFSPETRQEATN